MTCGFSVNALSSLTTRISGKHCSGSLTITWDILASTNHTKLSGTPSIGHECGRTWNQHMYLPAWTARGTNHLQQNRSAPYIPCLYQMDAVIQSQWTLSAPYRKM